MNKNNYFELQETDTVQAGDVYIMLGHVLGARREVGDFYAGMTVKEFRETCYHGAVYRRLTRRNNH